MMRLTTLLAILTFAAACGDETSTPRDQGVNPFPDVLWGTADYTIPPPPPGDFGPPPCTLGLPNTCASCTDICPGNDDKQSQRTCENRKCGVACKADYYDVDNDEKNGCEVADDLPLHNTEATAKKLADIGDNDTCTGCTLTAVIPSDGRRHLTKPEDRSEGIPDYYKVYIDDGWYSLAPYVRVDASPMSSGIKLTVKGTFLCKSDKSTKFTKTMTVTGGSSNEMTLDSDCPTSDDSGDLTIEVKKTGKTTHTKEEYTLIYHG